MKVTIKGQEYNFTFDSVWGPMYLYEEVAGDKMPSTQERQRVFTCCFIAFC